MGIKSGYGMEFDKYSHMISFEGHFWEGLRHGVGTEMWSNGTMMYKGEYSRGLRQGRGIEYDWEGIPLFFKIEI
jgi:antitoxin component YwqK of YwqJK toxin-antitoxin module